jgi:hypothetical protein
MQHLATRLPALFEETQGHSLRPYAFQRDFARMIGHLISGEPAGQYFSKGTKYGEAKFYKVIWPLFAECVWEAIQGRAPLSPAQAETNYRYKKAMRIISSPDLEPIKYLFQYNLPMVTGGPTLRGCFNQLSRKRGWGDSALTTDVSGRDPRSGALIQTQAVFGGKHISDKTRELAARMRSVHLRCDDNGNFAPEPDPGTHYLVVDGDWPVESKINLYEAGFSGIFEIAELDRLAAELDRLAAELDRLARQAPGKDPAQTAGGADARQDA